MMHIGQRKRPRRQASSRYRHDGLSPFFRRDKSGGALLANASTETRLLTRRFLALLQISQKQMEYCRPSPVRRSSSRHP